MTPFNGRMLARLSAVAALAAILAVLPDPVAWSQTPRTNKDYAAEVWYRLMAPAGTPTATVRQIAGWTTAALQAQEVNRKLMGLGFLPDGTCGAEFVAFVRKQYDDYGRVIREMNIKAE